MVCLRNCLLLQSSPICVRARGNIPETLKLRLDTSNDSLQKHCLLRQGSQLDCRTEVSTMAILTSSIISITPVSAYPSVSAITCATSSVLQCLNSVLCKSCLNIEALTLLTPKGVNLVLDACISC